MHCWRGPISEASTAELLHSALQVDVTIMKEFDVEQGRGQEQGNPVCQSLTASRILVSNAATLSGGYACVWQSVVGKACQRRRVQDSVAQRNRDHLWWSGRAGVSDNRDQLLGVVAAVRTHCAPNLRAAARADSCSPFGLPPALCSIGERALIFWRCVETAGSGGEGPGPPMVKFGFMLKSGQ